MFIEIKSKKRSKIKLVCGIGINDADYSVQSRVGGKVERCPFYVKWTKMLERCYCARSQEERPTYKDCLVCEEWLTFSNFRAWMTKQDWQGKQLDKDILVQGNKMYSSDKCIFVTMEINLLLNDHAASRGAYPLGTSYHKASGKFAAQYSLRGNTVNLGYSPTPELAHAAYKKAKYAHIKEIAEQQSEPLRSALLNYKIQ